MSQPTDIPMPPADLVSDHLNKAFVPAFELSGWGMQTFVDEMGALHNPDHLHLSSARIGALWTNVANEKQGRRIVGQAEIPRPPTTGGAWGRARWQCQINAWFGLEPDFIITIDAEYWADGCDALPDPMAARCALLEHELYHCGQAKDEFGAPKFSKQSGLPVFAMRGHDVEEFVGVIARYGAPAGSPVRDMVNAANAKPVLSSGGIAMACGTCQLRAA